MSGLRVVYVVDRDQPVREALQGLIESAGLPVRTFANAQDFLHHLSHRQESAVGCVVVGVRLPGMKGHELQCQFNTGQEKLPVIVLTGHDDPPAAAGANRDGQVTFVEKSFDQSELLERVGKALAHASAQRQRAHYRAELDQRLRRLTPRERQVMGLVVRGKANRGIAEELDLSPKTVEVHRARMMSKMEAKNIAELVRLCMMMEQDGEGAGARV